MKPVHPQGRDNLPEATLVHAAEFTLSLILWNTVGAGKVRWLQDFYTDLFTLFARLLSGILRCQARVGGPVSLGGLQVAVPLLRQKHVTPSAGH
jgi:hypothetical protein